MFVSLFVLASLCADPASPEVPKNVAKWQASLTDERDSRVAQAEKLLDMERKSLKNAKPADKKKALAKVKEREKQVADAKALDIYSLPIGAEAEVGSIGRLDNVKVVTVIDDTKAVVTRTTQVLDFGSSRPSKALVDELIVTGVNTATWANGQKVALDGIFEATHIDKAKRMIVFKPFDAEKWKKLGSNDKR